MSWNRWYGVVRPEELHGIGFDLKPEYARQAENDEKPARR